MSSDLSGLTQLATDWPSTPSLEFGSPAKLLSTRPQLLQAPAVEGTRPNIFSESGLAMAQTQKCPIILAAPAGTRKASGTAHLCHSQRRGLTVRIGSGPQGATSTPGWTHTEQARGGLRDPTCSPWDAAHELRCQRAETRFVGTDVHRAGEVEWICCSNWRGEGASIPGASASGTWVLESGRSEPKCCIFTSLAPWPCLVHGNASVCASASWSVKWGCWHPTPRAAVRGRQMSAQIPLQYPSCALPWPPFSRHKKWVHGWSSTKSREEWYRQFMSNGLIWNKLVVTEVTASPISIFSPGPSFSLALELKRYSAGIWCSTCSLTEIYFRKEDDFLDWLPLLPVLLVTVIQVWTLCKDSTWRSWPITIRLTGD